MYQNYAMARGRAVKILVGSSLLIGTLAMQGCFAGPRPYYGGGYQGWAPAPAYFFAPPRPIFAPRPMAFAPPRPFFAPARTAFGPRRPIFTRPSWGRDGGRRQGDRVVRAHARPEHRPS